MSTINGFLFGLTIKIFLLNRSSSFVLETTNIDTLRIQDGLLVIGGRFENDTMISSSSDDNGTNIIYTYYISTNYITNQLILNQERDVSRTNLANGC